jgi:micrococcal nuclease
MTFPKLSKKEKKIIFLLVVSLAVFILERFFGFSFSKEQPTSGCSNKVICISRVASVVDGDTIKLETGETVRYIGINTPETVHPSKPVECFGKEASKKNKELVDQKEVRLEKDISDKDKYGRLLRYVYTNDDLLVNAVLVEEGFAYASNYPPDEEFKERFGIAEKEAKQEKRGLWAENVCTLINQ